MWLAMPLPPSFTYGRIRFDHPLAHPSSRRAGPFDRPLDGAPGLPPFLPDPSTQMNRYYPPTPTNVDRQLWDRLNYLLEKVEALERNSPAAVAEVKAEVSRLRVAIDAATDPLVQGQTFVGFGQTQTNPSTAAPSGPAGGTLNGTYPNPSINTTSPLAVSGNSLRINTLDTGWSVTNETPTKTLDVSTATLTDVANVLGTLIELLKTNNILGS